MGKITRGLKTVASQDSDVAIAKLAWKGIKAAGGGVALASQRRKEKKASKKDAEVVTEESQTMDAQTTSDNTEQKFDYSLDDHANDDIHN